MNNRKELRQVNTDIIFFFLLVICSIISFFLILEKKRTILHNNHYSNKEQNDIYHINRFIILIVATYFTINAYISLIDLKNQNKSNKEIKEQENIFYASCLTLIAAYIYYNSQIESETLIYY